MDMYYYRVLREQHRELIINQLGNPQGSFATEELVRRLTENIGRASDNTIIQAPTPLDRTQLRRMLQKTIGKKFLTQSLIHEPQICDIDARIRIGFMMISD